MTPTQDLESRAAVILAETCFTIIGAGGAGERIILLAEAYTYGLSRREVMCDRCHTGPMTLGVFITTHYAKTEAEHREALRRHCELGDNPGDWSTLNPGLHKPGDARLAAAHECWRPFADDFEGRENPSGL